jgi:uncharacterized LabA/DUF88 family protein
LQTSGENKKQGVRIFLDNSNLWIAAKTLQSKRRGFNSSEDPRIRINIYELAELIAKNRSREANIYGSVPPPTDEVWKKFEENNWKVDKKKRSKITGKEKQVDSQIVADVAEIAKAPEKTTIAMVSGDADILPGLEKVINAGGWNIEIYMWRHAIAGALREFASHHSNVEITELDEYFDKITFTSCKKRLYGIKGGYVLEMTPDAFVNNAPDDEWCRKLEDLANWPFWYYITENDLLIAFCTMTGCRFQDKDAITELQSLPNVISVKRYKKCRFKFRCRYGTKCRFYHTPRERKHFKEHAL